MAVNSKKLLIIMLLLVVLLLFSATAAQPMTSLPNCPTNCGSVTIPFPFGITEDCSIDNTFLISCNQTSSPHSHTNSTPFLPRTNLSVLNISPNGQLHVAWPVANDCYTDKGELANQTYWEFYLDQYNLVVSSRNEFMVIGCNTVGLVLGTDFEGKNYTSGCVSLCSNGARLADIGANGSCSGNGCCETSSIPKGLSYIGYISGIAFNITNFTRPDFNPCGQAFLVEDGAYNFVSKDLVKLEQRAFPVVLDWAVGNKTCQEAHKEVSSYACKADNSQCHDATDRRGYLPHGCQGVSVCIIGLLLGSFYMYWALKKRKLIKLKEQFFKQNGGLLLQQQIARHRGSAEMTKVFSKTELEEATNNFDKDKILGQGGQGTVYRGLLPENRTVAIKKSKFNDPNQIEQFINEVIVLSQINHRNVVKLLGCCLETEVPLLVYEFIPNGTVYEHLHDQSQVLKLTWKTRLRIAVETAGALAYLHSATSTPIIHRDVKTANILLNHNLTTKVSDFGASRIIPLDQSQLTTLVQGTLGYLDPEYFYTSQLTEKSDVYSFGVVLAELLTGKKALSFERPEVDRNLAVYFVSKMKEGHLLHIVDSHIIDGTNVEQLTEVANIARRCLKVNGEERPTMKEVTMEIERIIVMEKHPWGSVPLSSDETKNFLKAAPSVFNVEDGVSGSGIISTSGFDSMNRISMSLGGGR
ncbi:Wall-associated receptor kinase, galacturonan-binding domain [Sesbania bispinosa]|nr:Wall-associated receptor kinase, galacturonan-binding domain [Sesbania bispinosa]